METTEPKIRFQPFGAAGNPTQGYWEAERPTGGHCDHKHVTRDGAARCRADLVWANGDDRERN